jgi:hypothetical protein
MVATALARAGSWLLEPVDAVERPAAIMLHPVVAVVALASGAGTTTVARALAIELATRHPVGAAVVGGDVRAGPLAVAGRSATVLARAVGTSGAGQPRSAGRLCLVEGGDDGALADRVRSLAPLVLDVGYGQPASVPVSLADHVGASLARIGPPPLVVLNRSEPSVDDPERWVGRADMEIGDAGAIARLATAGRVRGRTLGTGLAELGERCVAVGGEW